MPRDRLHRVYLAFSIDHNPQFYRPVFKDSFLDLFRRQVSDGRDVDFRIVKVFEVVRTVS